MIFDLRSFIKSELLNSIGKQADYWVILNAAGWLEKGVLSEEDLAEVNALIEAQHVKVEEEGVEEI